MSDEKPSRCHRRFNLSFPLRVNFRNRPPEGTGSNAGESVSTEEEQTITTTLSSGGCFFYVTKKPEVGTPATLLLDIPIKASGRGGRILCQGKVVWVTDHTVEGKVGVACTIDSYRFKPPRSQ